MASTAATASTESALSARRSHRWDNCRRCYAPGRVQNTPSACCLRIGAVRRLLLRAHKADLPRGPSSRVRDTRFDNHRPRRRARVATTPCLARRCGEPRRDWPVAARRNHPIVRRQVGWRTAQPAAGSGVAEFAARRPAGPRMRLGRVTSLESTRSKPQAARRSFALHKRRA